MTKLLKIILIGTGVTTTATAATVGVVVVKNQGKHSYPTPTMIKYKVPKLATPPVVVFSQEALAAFEKARNETATLLMKLGYAEYANNLRNLEVIPKERLNAEQIQQVVNNIAEWTDFFVDAKAKLMPEVQTKIDEDKKTFERLKTEMATIIGEKAHELAISGDHASNFLNSVGAYNDEKPYSVNVTTLYIRFVSDLLKLDETLATRFEAMKQEWINKLKLDYTETSIVDKEPVATLTLNEDQLELLSEVESQKYDPARSFDENVKTLENLEDSIWNQIDNFGYIDYDNQ